MKYIIYIQFLFALILVIFCNIARELALAYYFGTGEELDLFRLSTAIPVATTGLIAESLMAALIPIALSLSANERNYLLSKTVLSVSLAAALFNLVVVPLFIYTSSAELSASEIFLNALFSGIFIFFFLMSTKQKLQLLADGRKPISVAHSGIVYSIFTITIIFVSGLLYIKPNHTFLIVQLGLAAVICFSIYIYLDKKNRLSEINIENSEFLKDQHINVLKIVITLCLFKLINVVPRLLDRHFLLDTEVGSVAAFDYSITLISLPITISGIIFVYLLLPKVVSPSQSGSKLLGILLMCSVLGVACFLIQKFLASPLLPFIFLRGDFDSNSLLALKQQHDIHLQASFPILIITFFVIILSHIKAYYEVLSVGFLKLSCKIYLLSNLNGIYTVQNVSETLVQVEWIAAISLIILYFYRVKYRS